jgi:protoporphyrinogen/coproporphyrinogen III oxidase
MDESPLPTRIPALVIGAGLSGLACAYSLRKAGVDALCVEAADAPGGVIRTQHRDGYLLELGPQSFNATAAIVALCGELGIADQMIAAPPKAPRYILLEGQPRRAPLSPLQAASFFGLRTKLCFLRDMFGHSAPPTHDESVADFARRKLSKEFLEKVLGPFVSGIYAGDPEKLSLRSAFPVLYEAEKSSGSVVRGLLFGKKKRGKPRQRPTLQSFHQGNQTLIDALGANLGPNLRCGVPAKSIRQSAATTLEVTLTTNETIVADQLVIATPSLQAAQLLRNVDTQYSTTLESIDYAPVAVVSLGYPKASVKHDLNGFGFLIPRSAGTQILGTIWNSSLFPGRAPQDHVLFTSFVGGATNRVVVTQTPEQLVATTHRELSSILGITQPPDFSHVQIWPRAIPQYSIGHSALMDQLATLSKKYPNIALVGNYTHGPAVGTVIEHAVDAATILTQRFNAGTNVRT